MLRAYKYRLHPTKEQKIFFAKSFGCARYVYNWALNKRIEAYQTENRRINSIMCDKVSLCFTGESTPIKIKNTEYDSELAMTCPFR